MEGVEGDSKESCDTLFRTIQWVRTLFNVFADEQSCRGVDSQTLNDLWTKKFLLMFECQKELNIKVKVATEVKKKPVKKAPKRKRAPKEEPVDIVELMQEKRRSSIFLIDHLLDILVHVCPRIGKKSVPWAKEETPGSSIHGDISVVQGEVEKVVEQMADLLRLCLATLEHLFSWNHVSSLPSDSDAVTTRKKARREKLMAGIEHCILQEDGERSAGSEPEISVYGYLVDMCDMVPNVGVAVALLNGVSVISHYLRLRPVNYRLCAIQWILAKKLADLVPHEEKRKSKVYEQDSTDPDLSEKETKQIFACFTRATFGTIYKVLFVAMNDALAAEVVPSTGVLMRRADVQECLRTWSIAAGCLALFGLMLRVRELRSTSLLVTGIKEGRRFLAMMWNKNSSFMYLLEDKSRLASVTDRVVEIIKSVQIGNRNFQNICVHAKANRSNILLKLVPDFRVTNEQWMRAIQTKLVGFNCQDAFEIGLLKPRDINVSDPYY
ncbi:unnamed protein product [Heligmosomoides polygyrus]|uniref:MSC domain-containing protein n=1 Tax=Heligmosomoides polygyrus TaxID=6339 RepID=A0A3P8AK57_HELPZ|nr:unnamed protein product [Heligmosomoides polygyrus]